jgi:Tetratricopeptide repeat
MNIRKAIIAWAAAATLIIGGAAYANPLPDPDPANKTEKAEREAELYEDGSEAIDEGKWDQAISKFKSVVEMQGSRADGSLYWMAYALTKAGRRAEAVQTIEGLRKTYPKSKWIDDANALELEAKRGLGKPVAPERIQDEDLKMIAINSLMHSDPEKAYPLLEKIVRGPSAKKIKERALFILAQSPSPRAEALIGDIARGNANPDLQRDAVRYIGIHGGKKSRALLAELYGSGSREVKKEVLHAFMLSNDKERVLNAAKAEKDNRLREEAIRLLGVMNARNELSAMYATETSMDMKEEIIQALFIAGDTTRLGELTRTEKDPKLRREAIRKLGLAGGSAQTLLAIYNAETNVDVKEAVIEAFFLQNNARALIDLSKRETNQQLRREALQKLSVMNDDEALQYMLQILED